MKGAAFAAPFTAAPSEASTSGRSADWRDDTTPVKLECPLCGEELSAEEDEETRCPCGAIIAP